MVQAFPKSAWGREFLTVPSVNYNTISGNTDSPSTPNIFYRVCVSDPTTVVKINGVITTLPLTNNFYYEIPASTSLYLIESDKPVIVAQYFPSRGACGLANPANGDGDPETIYLSPVEQNINKVLWNANAQASINQNKHYINVVIPNSGTAISSFRLDGVTVSALSFLPHPQNASFSYARLNVSSTPGGGSNVGLSHIVQSDSGFNAIAYGYGVAESYGYNVGTNIKDFYQQISVATEFGIEPTPAVCKGSPFRFRVSLPYCADSIKWNLSNLPGPPSPSIFLTNYSTCTPGVGGPDSTTIVNGKTLFWYSIPTIYNFSISGSYPVFMTVYAPNADGCGSEQEIDFELNVYDPPVADFNWTGGGCVAEPVQFQDNTTTPRPSYLWFWDFGDPGVAHPIHLQLKIQPILFSSPGIYDVNFYNITTPGCISNTKQKQITIAPIPSATITGSISVCINTAPEPQITFTASDGKAPYTFTYNINGGLNQIISTTGTNTTVSINVPTNVAGIFQYNLTEVKNSGSTLCVRSINNASATVNVNLNTGLTLTTGTNNQSVCENNAITNLVYTIDGGGNNATSSGLPSGVNGVYNAGLFTISGTPTTPGTYNYTVNATGLCLPNSLSGVITVNPDASLALTSGSNTQTLCINTPLSDISYSIGGGGTGGTVSGLPTGVTGTYNSGILIISGTPTVTGTFNYTVTTTGTCIQKTANGTLIVNPDATLALTSAPVTTAQSVCENVAIADITYSIGGGGSGGTVTGLPPGVNGVYNAGVVTISGVPNFIGSYPFTVQTTGICVQKTLTGTITVNPDAAISLTSAPSSNAQELCRNSTLTPITYAITGGGTGEMYQVCLQVLPVFILVVFLQLVVVQL